MAKKKREYDDDDGRTIADMSGVERPNLFTFRSTQSLRQGTPPSSEEGDASEPDYSKYYNRSTDEMSRKEAFMAIMGSLGAALLIAGIFIAVFAVAIVLMLIFWK